MLLISRIIEMYELKIIVFLKRFFFMYVYEKERDCESTSRGSCIERGGSNLLVEQGAQRGAKS